MSKTVIDNFLHRPLKSIGDYENLLPKSSCKSKFLGDGDTGKTMDLIKAQILKYYQSTNQLAEKLKKPTTSQTIDSVYSFLYNHIQYAADATDQLLRSPACSLSDRKNGIDCKSFSIFAGCLLSSLGIKYYIRRIKQPGYAANQFTHVYIKVPTNQTTGKLTGGSKVIDATKHSNTESQYLVKDDIYMDLPHYGLNAPAQPTASVALSPHANLTSANNAFNGLMVMLNKAGVSKTRTCAIMTHIKGQLNKGIDPHISISRQGIVIERKVFEFKTPTGSPALLPSTIMQTQPTSLNGPTTDGGGSTSGTDWGGILDGAIESLNDDGDGWVSEIFSKIVDFFGCMGSTTNPETAKHWIKNGITPVANQRLTQLRAIPGNNVSEITNKANTFMKDLAIIKAHQLFHKDESSTECGKKANQAMADFVGKIEEMMNQTFLQMESSYNISKQTISFVASDLTHLGLANQWKGKTTTASYDKRTFTVKAGQNGGGVQVDPLPGDTAGGNTGTGGTNGGGTALTNLVGGGNTIFDVPTKYKGLNVNSNPALILDFINWMVSDDRLHVNWKRKDLRIWQRNKGTTGLNNRVQFALYITSKIDGSSTGSGNSTVTLPNLNPQPTEMSFSPILLGSLVLGGIYLAYKKSTKTNTKK